MKDYLSNTMKKIFTIYALLCLSINLLAQTKQEALHAIKENILQINKQLPQKVSFFTIQKIDIQNNDYIVCIIIDEQQQDFDNYVNYMRNAKSNLFSLVAGQHQEFTHMFIASGLNITFKITGNSSRRTKQFTLSSSEIKESFGSSYESKDYIKDIIAEIRKTVPLDWRNGLLCTDIKIEGEYVSYKIKTDETILTISLLKKVKNEGHEMEDSIIEEFNNANGSLAIFIKHLKKSNMGIKYTYWSEGSHDSVVFVISPYEIRTKVNDKPLF